MTIPTLLDRIADVVLRYRPNPKSAAAKKRGTNRLKKLRKPRNRKT